MKKTLMKVLILEDNQYDAELNIKTLQKENWIIESRIVSDENSFRTSLQNFDPDVILSDYNLPVFNGMDALKISKEEKPLTPFIIVTGSLDEETAVNCIKQGAWDYVLKEHLIRLNPAVTYALELWEEREKREEIENSLSESQQHYITLTQNSPDVIMRFDKNYRHLFVNNTIYDQLGLKPELFINKSHHEMGIFDTALCDFWEEQIKKVFESAKPHEVEFSIPKNDTVVYYEWRLFPEFNPHGEVTTVLAVARDISFKKDAEYSLRISEERLKLALEATSDGLWDWNMKTDEIYFSPRYFSLLGYNPGELKNNLKGFKTIRQVILSRKESLEIEFRLIRKDGTYAWILSRGTLTFVENEINSVRIVGTNVDISLRKRQDAIQKTILDISNAVVTTRNLQELFEKIQEILSGIIDTTNCYVALYDEKKDLISLPFHKDEKDRFLEFPHWLSSACR
jgi:PAS domain S-box-containing protein